MTTQIITATILDTATTPGYLVVEIEDQLVRAELTEQMDNTAQALPQLVEALGRAGYAFHGEPTDEAGEVELVKARR